MAIDILDQSEIQPEIKRSKYNTVYYSHSIYYYNTTIEQQDIIFLKTLNSKIINPNGLGLGHEMIQYLFLVERSDAVWFRGDTIGVILECLSALAMDKPVYSLATKDNISDHELKYFITVFKADSFFEHDLQRFKTIFTDYYNNLTHILQEGAKL